MFTIRADRGTWDRAARAVRGDAPSRPVRGRRAAEILQVGAEHSTTGFGHGDHDRVDRVVTGRCAEPDQAFGDCTITASDHGTFYRTITGDRHTAASRRGLAAEHGHPPDILDPLIAAVPRRSRRAPSKPRHLRRYEQLW